MSLGWRSHFFWSQIINNTSIIPSPRIFHSLVISYYKKSIEQHLVELLYYLILMQIQLIHMQIVHVHDLRCPIGSSCCILRRLASYCGMWWRNTQRDARSVNGPLMSVMVSVADMAQSEKARTFDELVSSRDSRWQALRVARQCNMNSCTESSSGKHYIVSLVYSVPLSKHKIGVNERTVTICRQEARSWRATGTVW